MRLSPLAVLTSAGVGLVIVGLAWLLDVRMTMETRSNLQRKLERVVEEQKYRVRNELRDLEGAATALAHIASGRPVDAQLRADFLAFARTRPTIDQIRLIAPDGREVVNIKRIRARSGTHYHRDTTSESPRDMSGEEWMGPIASLAPGELSSEIDWKALESGREGGAVRIPLLRIAAPVDSAVSRRPQGLVVIEFAANDLFRDLERNDTKLDANTFVATLDGRWIRGPGGFAVAGSSTVTSLFPLAWEKISAESTGVFHLAEGLVVFDTIPLDGDAPGNRRGMWKVFTVESPATLAARDKEATGPVLGWSILALCLFVPLTCLVVTDREQKREASRAREEAGALLQSITDSSLDGIVAGQAVRDSQGDIKDFRTIFINPAASYILKTFDRKEASEGREFPLFFSAEFLARCVEVVATGVRFETEQSAQSSVLGTRWFRILVVRLRDGVVMSFTDITEQKLVMHELRLARDAAEVANRTKSQFLTMMGHEIRTPMNGLLGFASLLESTDLNEEQRDYARTLRLSGEALLRILEDIIDYSHMESEVLALKNQPVSVKELITQVSKLFTLAVGERKLELVARIAPDVPAEILGDDVRLRQILVNLIGNAVKFTQEGFILIKAVRETLPQGDFLVFHIVDSGSGISPEMIDRLFKPFSQVDTGSNRRYGGTGLGLSICRRLVETMGGEIGVRSAPEKGSDFYFSIPIRLPDFHSAEISRARTDAGSKRRKPRILVVDDDSINRKLIMRMIEKAGAEAQMAESGVQAIHAFQEEQFDLIIMDIQMPGMDGIETARKIREIERRNGTGRRTPISALTANAGDGDRERCFEAGMDDFFCKPIRIDCLERLIEKNTV